MVGKEIVKQMEGGKILKAQDGTYRWQYDMSMWKNATILITLMKVFGLAASAPVLMLTFVALVDSGIRSAAEVLLQVGWLIYGIMIVLVLVSYIILAIINGSHYQVVFEMDEKGIKHMQMQKQFDKSQLVAMLVVLAGIGVGDPTTTAAGLLAASKNSSYSKFEDVKKIILKPSRNVIYVSELFEKNQVYVTDEEFSFVSSYLTEHCKKAKVVGIQNNGRLNV